jgi:transcriptional regulator GlxA family with amidase domain
MAARDPNVARAAKWARERLEESFSIEEFARAGGLSARTFARRVHDATGLSPIRFLQRLRMDAAMHLLETTKLPFDAVALQVGYKDTSTLRRILARDANRKPGELRG